MSPNLPVGQACDEKQYEADYEVRLPSELRASLKYNSKYGYVIEAVTEDDRIVPVPVKAALRRKSLLRIEEVELMGKTKIIIHLKYTDKDGIHEGIWVDDSDIQKRKL